MTADFDSHCLAPGQHLHVRHTTRFKSAWVDVFLPQLLRPVAATQLALLSRLLERGTSRLPDLRALNRHTDWLYGAALSTQTISIGPYQVLHLHYDAMAGAFAPADTDDDLLAAGLQLLGDALHEPFLQHGQFPLERIEQEKLSLQRYVQSLDADRTGMAQRRCMQSIGAGTCWALESHGAPEELDAIDGAQLLHMLGELNESNVMEVYVCGDVDAEKVARLCRQALPAPTNVSRSDGGTAPWIDLPANTGPHRICEHADVTQGRLVLGFRTGTRRKDHDHAVVLLLNLVLGGDAHSRLYRRIREEGGLCYHIASYADTLAGLLFVEAGIDADDRATVVNQILAELAELGRNGPSSAELERVVMLSRQRLESAEDGRDGLVRFHYVRRLIGLNETRLEFQRDLSTVTAGQIRELAAAIELDTEYFLAPTDDTQVS